MVVLGRFFVFYSHSNICLNKDMWLRAFAPFLKIKNILSYFSFWTYIYWEWWWLFHCNTGTKALALAPYSYDVHKKDYCFDLYTHPHSQKWTIDLFFKNQRTRKRTTIFKTSPPPYCIDVINVCSLIRNNFLKRKWRRD